MNHVLCALILFECESNNFDFGSKKKSINHETPGFCLTFGGQTLTIAQRYKYLGLIFTPNLRFDTHVTEYLLPKVRKIAGYVRHLLGTSFFQKLHLLCAL